MRSAIPVGLILALGTLAGLPATASGAEHQVAILLQQGQQAYERDLDITAAQNYIDQAIRLVRQYGITGNNAALAYALRGVIHIWMGEEQRAIDMFKQAFTHNPNLVLPAAWGGPDVNQVMERARRLVPPPPVVAPPPVAPPHYVTCPGGVPPLPDGRCPPPYVPPVTCPGGVPPLPDGRCPPVMCPGGVPPLPDGRCPPVTCPGGVPPLPDGRCPPPPPPVPLTRHTPVTEQLWNHPVPIYLDVSPRITVGRVFLFYKSPSDVSYQRIEMARSGPGYYAEIPCTMLQPTAWDYYITVLDPQGHTLATEGSPDQPFRINMVQVLSPGALFPTRPDGSLVRDCGPDGTGGGAECPPGFPGCPPAACPRTCMINDDCLPGEVCVAGCCERPTAVGDDPREPIGLFLTLSLGGGFGIVAGRVEEPRWYGADVDADGRVDRFHGPDHHYQYERQGYYTDQCPEDIRLREGDPPPAIVRQCVKIDPGLAAAGGVIRLGVGYFIIPQLSLSANFRMAFPFGDTFPWLVEGRLHYWFLAGPEHFVGAFGGGGGGLMTHMISDVEFDQRDDSCPGNVCEPRSKVYKLFYKSSKYGAISAGLNYIYKINDLFGLGGELGLNTMVPDFAFNFDVTLQAILSF